jgi:hypothetical protein
LLAGAPDILIVESFFASPAGAACAPAASASGWLRQLAGGAVAPAAAPAAAPAVAPAAAPAAASSARARAVVATRREEAAREGRAAVAPAQPAATGFARAVDVALEQLDALIAAKHGAAPPAKRAKRLLGARMGEGAHAIKPSGCPWP